MDNYGSSLCNSVPGHITLNQHLKSNKDTENLLVVAAIYIILRLCFKSHRYPAYPVRACMLFLDRTNHYTRKKKQIENLNRSDILEIETSLSIIGV